MQDPSGILGIQNILLQQEVFDIFPFVYDSNYTEVKKETSIKRIIASKELISSGNSPSNIGYEFIGTFREIGEFFKNKI